MTDGVGMWQTSNYLRNLGPRLETLNDLRDACGKPQLTRGELLQSDLAIGVTPHELRENVRAELRRINAEMETRKSPNLPTIEEE